MNGSDMIEVSDDTITITDPTLERHKEIVALLTEIRDLLRDGVPLN